MKLKFLFLILAFLLIVAWGLMFLMLPAAAGIGICTRTFLPASKEESLICSLLRIFT